MMKPIGKIEEKMMSQADQSLRQKAARRTFDDVLGKVRLDGKGALEGSSSALPGKQLAALLEKNFAILDPDGNGITKEEIARGLLMEGRFTPDELAMLQLLSKYFDTISNMSDDEEGVETRITQMDKEVLYQFLVHGGMTMEDLHKWRAIAADADADTESIARG